MMDDEKRRAHNEAARRYRERNKERISAYNSAYYQENKEALDAAHAEWAKKNPEAIAKISRESTRRCRAKKETPEG